MKPRQVHPEAGTGSGECCKVNPGLELESLLVFPRADIIGPLSQGWNGTYPEATGRVISSGLQLSLGDAIVVTSPANGCYV
jgi:hypothetical protein